MQTEVKPVTDLRDEEILTPYRDYGGIFRMEKRIVIFDGHTVPLESIAQVISRPIRPVPKIGFGHIVICIIMAFILGNLSSSLPSRRDFEFFNSLLFLGTLACIFLVGYGIWERFRPLLYGFTIELTSGNYYPIVHKKKDYIDNIYQGFTEAMREKKDFEANFKNLTINSGQFAGSTNPINITSNATIGPITGGSTTMSAEKTTANNGQYAGANNPTVVGNDNLGSVTGGNVTVNNS
jgi:hypothetical protein